MSETCGQVISASIKEIEEDLADMKMDQTSNNLMTGIEDFHASENTATGVQEAAELESIMQDAGANGLSPTYRLKCIILVNWSCPK